LYRGADFIEQFMENITSQENFADFCELVIIDANSPENEFEAIKKYLKKFKNIQYVRCNYRIGIYDAWNMGIDLAKGEYLTNANLDDLRRQDSFSVQASYLDNLKFVDVVYQDFYYTFDLGLTFDEIEQIGIKSNLPIVTAHNMLVYNSPHNAPMWRKSLHDELGNFDTNYRSAGDYEFWLRCMAANKHFYKINDPHVVYYQNPKGLSTQPGTRGIIEGCEILKKYARKLISTEVVDSKERFATNLTALSGGPTRIDYDKYSMAQSALRHLSQHSKWLEN
jgi:glycosyltransferase involved in cell wall biosynthesis